LGQLLAILAIHGPFAD